MSFYSGDIPKRIVRQVRQQGGILSEKDFAQSLPNFGENCGCESA